MPLTEGCNYKISYMSKPLYITEFTTVEQAIAFAKKYWPNQELDAIESMREINTGLDENKKWFLMIGVCDICGAEDITFMPAAVFEYEITGIECPQCGNFSVYPKEQENEI